MNHISERVTVLSGFLWRWMERVGAQGVHFIVALVLARVLAPEIFGTVSLINVFIAILQVFVDSGLGNSLIQKKDADDLDFSTVFYFNICMCCLLYLGMFFAAPAIADFYIIEKNLYQHVKYPIYSMDDVVCESLVNEGMV